MTPEQEKEFRRLLNNLDQANNELKEFISDESIEEDFDEFLTEIEFRITDKQEENGYI